MYMPSTGRSSARARAAKPASSRPSFSSLTRTTLLCAQWWFVATRPSGETNEAEQPGIRSDARRARSNHAASGSKS